MKDSQVQRHIHGILSANRGKIIWLAVLCLLGALLPSVSPLIYGRIIDDLIPAGDLSQLYIYVLLLIVIPVAASVVSNLRTICAYKVSNEVTKGLRRLLMDKMMTLSHAEYIREGVSTLSYRVTRACGQIGEVFLNVTVISFINSTLTLLMVFIPMFFLEWRLALAALTAFPAVYLILRSIRGRVVVRDKRLMEQLMKGESIVGESISGLKDVKLSGGQGRQRRIFDNWLEAHAEAKLNSVHVHEFERVTLPEFCIQALYGVIFTLGAVLVVRGGMTVGTLVAFIAYVPRAFDSVKQLLGIQVTLKSIEPTIDLIEEVFAASSEENGTKAVSGCRGRITFEHVNFEYSQDGQFALKDITFCVEPGQAVAIVGETGGGKSTILDLLMRMYVPTSGRITLDGADIQKLSLEEYRAQFSVVQQSQFLWSDTLERNITYPDKETDRVRYDRAVRDAQLNEFINGLPEKDLTRIGEQGKAISGGEKQRISMAHAFYQDRGILLLDEPTSALDAQTEAAIRDVLMALKGTKTMISVTHRLSTILQFDRVLVMREGRIVEQGTPGELLAEDTYFKKMCAEQGLTGRHISDEPREEST